ncbi:hypothetical protein SNE40_001402 [Patella caerulea]|uniref:Uncharacterized protein n=1 Tax=Patella caerulea TaxID=87958 RepID=A0AAN8KNM4_PATCE
MGVQDINDLSVLEPQDFGEILTIIQARKLCKAIQNELNCPSSSFESGESFSSPIGASTSSESASPLPCSSASRESFSSTGSTDSELSNTDMPKSDWLRNYNIPYQKFPCSLQVHLHSNTRPMNSERREMVRILVDDIQSICRKPSSKDLSIIAMKIVERHEASFCDKSNGRVLGQGHISLYKQLLEKVNNNNRKRSQDQTSTSVKKGAGPFNNYGCIESFWKPSVNTETEKDDFSTKKEFMKKEFPKHINQQNLEMVEQLMQETYPNQRQMINEPLRMETIKEEYPYLFCKKYALIHFKCLTGVDLEKNYIIESKTMKQKILKYLRENMKSDSLKALFKELDSTTEVEGDLHLSQCVPLLLMSSFEESDFIQLFPETSDTAYIKSVIAGQKDKAPVICVVGKFYSSQLIHIFCEDTLLASLRSLDDAVMMAFSLYYILNLRYHSNASITLEFVQRILVGINPVKGTKSTKIKGKKINIHPKVLSLANKLNFDG